MSTGSFEEIVRSNLRQVEASPDFAGDHFWLAFDLHGSPANLKQLSEDLSGGGWSEIDDWNGWEGGFLYPRRLVGKSFEMIREAAESLVQVCRRHGAEIDVMAAINARPGPNASSITLYCSP